MKKFLTIILCVVAVVSLTAAKLEPILYKIRLL